jgi:Clp amino terminal domain, pathogenicity island component
LLREEEGVGARVLESLAVTLEDVRAQVARIIGWGDELKTGQIPFTPRAKKVLELALREAVSLGHNHIGTEHILLGIVRENEGVAAQILLDLGADAEKVRNAVVQGLSRPGSWPRPARVPPGLAGLPPHVPAETAEPPPAVMALASPARWPLHAVAAGWALFGVALGIGVLIGRLVWG